MATPVAFRFIVRVMFLSLIEIIPGPLEIQAMLPPSVVPVGAAIGESRRVAFVSGVVLQSLALTSLVAIPL